jgi:hypothetical protein
MSKQFIIALILLVIIGSADVSACTIFHTISDDGNTLVGRNYDWDSDDWDGEGGATIVFIAQTEDDYGMVLCERAGVDMPYDGMNDKGLFIGIAAVPDTGGPSNIFAPARKSLQMVREVLMSAKTVDEALAIFDNFFVAFGTIFGNPMVHFKIADAEGNNAILEFVNGEWLITQNSKQCQIMVNHYLTKPELGADSETSFERIDVAKSELRNGINSIDGVKDTLGKTAQESTVYSCVYDLENRKVFVSFRGGVFVEFDLGRQLLNGTHRYQMADFPNIVEVELPSPGPGLVIRPQSGFGFIGTKPILHYGTRILLSSSNTRKYGLELARFDKLEDKFDHAGAFYSIGIVLEQRLFRWFNMSMGTVGYLNFGAGGNHAIGFTSNLGWEPDNTIPFLPFVTYRNDTILYNGIDLEMINSISIGYNFTF